MRLPISHSTLLLIVPLLCGPMQSQNSPSMPQADGQAPPTAVVDRHSDPQWAAVAPHLPNPAIATPAELEMAADVLRARRFPEDALEYFVYAIRRGGDQSRLLNKIGVTELELNRVPIALAYFQRVVKLNKKSAEGWNNLGAAEHLEQHYGSALSDYHKAVKLNGASAVYHSNLGTAYFQEKDYHSARQEYEKAMAIDPRVFEHSDSGGLSAHVMSPIDRGRFCFEMARMQAKRGDDAAMLHWLAMASEAGFNVIGEMGSDADLARFRKDPRVFVLVQNGRALRNGTSLASAGAVPSLPAPTPKSELR